MDPATLEALKVDIRHALSSAKGIAFPLMVRLAWHC
jgi:hypothetical protein